MFTDNKDYQDKTFRDVDASSSCVSGVRMEGCSFFNVNFSNACLDSCKFVDCLFENTNFSVASLPNTLVNEVNFKQCKLVGVDWTKLRWPSIQIPGLLHFEECIMNDSTFFGLYLADSTFSSCRVHRVIFDEANCKGADFSGSDLFDSTFNRTCLSEANFVDACDYRIDVKSCDLKGAKFSIPEATSLLSGLDIEIID